MNQEALENQKDSKLLFSISYGPMQRYLYSGLWMILALAIFAFSFKDFHRGNIWEGLIGIGIGIIPISHVADYWLVQLEVTASKVIYNSVFSKRELYLTDIKRFFYGVRYGGFPQSFLVLETALSDQLLIQSSLVSGNVEFDKWLKSSFELKSQA